MQDDQTFTVFDGSRRVFAGARADAESCVRERLAADPGAPVLMFDDATGRIADVDLRALPPVPPPVRRGRPKLGVTAREVTLLPRHWEWLAAQPGGASVVLRRLVDEARRAAAASGREGRDAAYRFMHAMAGDRPGFEEAVRSLYAGDRPRLEAFMQSWPDDIRAHALKLAFG